MNTIEYNNDIDNAVDDRLIECLDLDNPKSFFLFAGAGSGKTRSLVNALSKTRELYGLRLRQHRQQIATITYTNAACDEIKYRLDNDALFVVSTIHSFAWNLIKVYQRDIKEWLKKNLEVEIQGLKLQLAKGRKGTKTAVERERKIKSKSKRLEALDDIKQIIYNPNGNNNTKDALNHSEVIKICAEFVSEKILLQKILIKKFPILLIDESQDTKKELIEALLKVQQLHKENFSLGMFGDTMQRIYSDGKNDIENDLPRDWLKPSKRMNHRSNTRIIKLINKIRAEVDNQEQLPRTEKKEGFVNLFIVSSDVKNKEGIEQQVSQKMAEITNDILWKNRELNVKTLILEHHMAATRMGFFDLFAPLYKLDQASLIEGTISGLRFFTELVFPIVKAKRDNDGFEVARYIRQYSELLKPEYLKQFTNQFDILKNVNKSVDNLYSLWENGGNPLLIDILHNLQKTKLLPIPDSLKQISQKTKDEILALSLPDETLTNKENAWYEAILAPFSQVEEYRKYIRDEASFGTHQGVKGLEYDRVLVILDDTEAKGFLFSYEKLLGVKELSSTDKKNIAAKKETGIDRTRRLFYVTCSRAKESLAIIAYSKNPKLVKSFAIKNKWFTEQEIKIIE